MNFIFPRDRVNIVNMLGYLLYLSQYACRYARVLQNHLISLSVCLCLSRLYMTV